MTSKTYSTKSNAVRAIKGADLTAVPVAGAWALVPTEYAQEAEHGDGPEYWNQFDSAEALAEDVQLYTENNDTAPNQGEQDQGEDSTTPEQGTEQEDSTRIAELTTERDQLRAKLAEVEGELRSLTGSAAPSTAASPVALVREVFESMPDAPRKDVIAECVARGVNKATAATQYQVNRKKQQAGEL